VQEARPGFACGEDDAAGVFQFRMNNVTADGSLDLTKKRRVPKATKRIESFHLNRGDVLFNATNSPELVGKTAFFPGYEEPVVYSNHFLRLRPQVEKIDGRYLARWLQFQFQRRVFEGMCKQWVNQATVGRDSLLALQIPLPPLAEQRRIAAILDAAEALRAKRRAALAKLDTLTQSIFLEMFGDPVTNARRWPTLKLGEVGRAITGNTPSRERAEYYGSEIEWIKSDNINTPFHYLTKATEGLSKEGRLIGRVAPVGSVLVTCIAGSPACIGNAAIADREVAFNQQINALVPAVPGTTEFIYGHFLVGKKLFRAAATNGMKGMVSKSAFEQVTLISPPSDLQRQFGRVFLANEKLAGKARASLNAFDSLFATLQQRAFRGEL
jgi:type I restriction enzyme S subunit